MVFRAYLKESLQLQRTKKCQTSKHFSISCQKKCFISKNFQRLFLVISSLPNAAGTTAQTKFLHHSFSKFHAFQHSFLLNLQLQLHNLSLVSLTLYTILLLTVQTVELASCSASTHFPEGYALFHTHVHFFLDHFQYQKNT